MPKNEGEKKKERPKYAHIIQNHSNFAPMSRAFQFQPAKVHPRNFDGRAKKDVGFCIYSVKPLVHQQIYLHLPLSVQNTAFAACSFNYLHGRHFRLPLNLRNQREEERGMNRKETNFQSLFLSSLLRRERPCRK